MGPKNFNIENNKKSTQEKMLILLNNNNNNLFIIRTYNTFLFLKFQLFQ